MSARKGLQRTRNYHPATKTGRYHHATKVGDYLHATKGGSNHLRCNDDESRADLPAVAEFLRFSPLTE